jgi:aromatase
VRYHHIGGVTRGMDVEWRIAPAGDGTDVIIVHRFAPPWPWPGSWIARRLVCGFFVHAIADRTLAGIKAYAEQRGAHLYVLPDQTGGRDAGSTDDAQGPGF